MFASAMVAAIDAARTLTKLDHLSTDIWKAWGAGQIGDEAQLLAMQLEARRKALRGDLVPVRVSATSGSNGSQPACDEEGGVNEKRSPTLLLTQTLLDG